MADAANLRLVRCPKCENLLPELPDFSLYQCGGCGAVLKAKQKGILEDGLAEIPDAVEGRGISEEGRILEAPEVKMGSAADSTEDGLFEKTHKEVTVSNGGTTSRAESTEARTDSDVITRKGKGRIRKLESSDNDYTSYPQGSVRSRNQSNHLNLDGPEYVMFQGERARDIRPPPVEPLRSRPVMDQCGVITDEPGGGPAAQIRYGDFRFYDEGQSSYEKNSYYESGERTSRYRGPDPDGISRMENLENGRAELIRRLDELKDQISRSCDISDKSKERLISNDRNAMASSISPDQYGRRQAANCYPDDVSPQYFTDPRGFTPYNPHMADPYPMRRHPHDLTHYSNNKSYRQEILRRPPSGPQPQYSQHHPYHELPGHYRPAPGPDINHHDLFMLHRHENFFHQPACSCAHCCDKSWPVPPKPVDSPGLHTRRFRNEPNVNPFGPQKLLPMNANNLDYENDGLSYQRTRKFVTAHKSGRLIWPVAGGAPFIACSNCFETLKLPKKCMLSGENGHKMKCGACSSIIMFELGNNAIVTSSSGHVDQVPTEIDDGSSGTLDDNVRYWNDGSNSANLNGFSNDYDDFGDKKSNLDLLSSTSGLSEDGQSPEAPILTEVKSLSDPNLSCPDESSLDNIAVNRFDKRNKSQRPDQERISLDRTNSQQKFVKDASVATEIDVSLTGFSNSCASQDSVEVSREADKPKVNKGGESFFAGLIKRSFIKDLKKSSQSVEVGGSQVFVNGHFIPDRVVKKAEKLAGPIQSGDYWYDKRAGFWGVMGHPCLGIIMPNIEEFNYPMPEKCAAGNTGVFVNGRELHHKDLDLLSSRGLPITKQRSYLLEITGKVIDEQTGEELDGLGKLAPTVERSKHGFGMKIPRFIAQIQSQK